MDYKKLKGTCTEIDTTDIIPDNEKMAALSAAGFSSTFVKGPTVNWWSAASWCLGLGKHLIDVREMRCFAKGTTLVQSGAFTQYC